MSAMFDLLGLDDDAQAWRDYALCAQVDSEIFFPDKGGSTRDAKRTCSMCPVRAKDLGGTGECLDYALEHGERFGIWGGKSERERRIMTPPKRADKSRCRNGHDLTVVGRNDNGRCPRCQLDNSRRNHERRMRLQRERRDSA